MDVYRSLDVPSQASVVAPKNRKSWLKRLPTLSLALVGTLALAAMVALVVTQSATEQLDSSNHLSDGVVGDLQSASSDPQTALQEWMSIANRRKTHFTEVFPAFIIANDQFAARGLSQFVPTLLETIEDYIKEMNRRPEINATTLPILLMPEFFWRPVRSELLSHKAAESLLNDLAAISAKYPNWLLFPGTIPTAVHTVYSSTGHKYPYVNTAPVIAEGRVLGLVSKSYESHIDQPGTVHDRGLVQRVPFNLRHGQVVSTTQSRFSFGGIPFNVEICLDHAYGTALNNEYSFCALRGPNSVALSAFQILLSASIEFQRECRCATYVLHSDPRLSGVHTAYDSIHLNLRAWQPRARYPAGTLNPMDRFRVTTVAYTIEPGKLPVRVFELGPDADTCKLPPRRVF